MEDLLNNLNNNNLEYQEQQREQQHQEKEVKEKSTTDSIKTNVNGLHTIQLVSSNQTTSTSTSTPTPTNMSSLLANISNSSVSSYLSLGTVNKNNSNESDCSIDDCNNSLLKNAVNIYLKKHKLDLTLLPNKKMIKLSDLNINLNFKTSNSTTSQTATTTPTPIPPTTTTTTRNEVSTVKIQSNRYFNMNDQIKSQSSLNDQNQSISRLNDNSNNNNSNSYLEDKLKSIDNNSKELVVSTIVVLDNKTNELENNNNSSKEQLVQSTNESNEFYNKRNRNDDENEGDDEDEDEDEEEEEEEDEENEELNDGNNVCFYLTNEQDKSTHLINLNDNNENCLNENEEQDEQEEEEDHFDLDEINSNNETQSSISTTVTLTQDQDSDIRQTNKSAKITNNFDLNIINTSTNSNSSNCSSASGSCKDNNSDGNKNVKRSRKKREPSLKLQQKLSIDDLELIVNCVKNRQASVSIADVKKDNYVDKILKVKLLSNSELLNNQQQNVNQPNGNFLSNGKSEALLKKSMFPKDLNTLFDTFVNSLCGQEHLTDENGITKPTLTCLVVDCGFKSFSEAEIMRHIKRHLAQDGYTCPTCRHQFASMTNLQRHLRIHAGDVGKEMKCPHCDYKASTITHVKRHMAHKHLERSLPCPHCSFMGATNAELKIHMARKHLELTGKNPLFLPKYLRKDYQCSICKEQYNDFKEYQTHMYEHTSASNRFQCTECPYNCKNYSKLKRHMLYHTGARNYECELCGNKFFQMEHLKRHMQSIHNIIIVSSNANNTNANNNTQSSTNSTKSSKTTNLNKQQKQMINNSNSNKKTNNFNKTISSTSTTINKQQQQQLLFQNYQASSSTSQQCYKITSKCIYKCHQCDFSTVKLFSLNEHVMNKHYKNIVLTNHDQLASSYLDEELYFDNDNDDDLNADLNEDQDYNDENNVDEDDDDDDDSDVDIVIESQYNEEETSLDEDNQHEHLDLISSNGDCQHLNHLNIQSSSSLSVRNVKKLKKISNCLTCSFCSLKFVKKIFLKRHLKNNHASQITAPILLSNDVIMLNPNIRFECGTCQLFFSNLNEYINHMIDRHKIQVLMLDSTNEQNTIQDQLKSTGKAEIICTSSSEFANISSEVYVTQTITNDNIIQSNNQQINLYAENNNNSNSNNNSNNKIKNKKNSFQLSQQQQLRNFINSSTNVISRQQSKIQQQQNQNTTVRINPLLFKRQNIQQTTLTKTQSPNKRLQTLFNTPTNNHLITNSLISNQINRQENILFDHHHQHQHLHHEHQQEQHQQHHHEQSNNIISFSNNSQIDISVLSQPSSMSLETSNQLEMIVNQYQNQDGKLIEMIN